MKQPRQRSSNVGAELKEIIANITTDHDTDTLQEVMDDYVKQILSLIESKLPNYMEFAQSEWEHGCAIGWNKAIDDMRKALKGEV